MNQEDDVIDEELVKKLFPVGTICIINDKNYASVYDKFAIICLVREIWFNREKGAMYPPRFHGWEIKFYVPALHGRFSNIIWFNINKNATPIKKMKDFIRLL